MVEGTNTAIRVPSVLWSQNQRSVYLKVEVADCVRPSVHFEHNGSHCSLHFTGSSGHTGDNFEFSLSLFAPLLQEKCKICDVMGTRYVNLTLPKIEKRRWARLTQAEKPPSFIKVDWATWDRLESDDESDDENLPGPCEEPLRKEKSRRISNVAETECNNAVCSVQCAAGAMSLLQINEMRKLVGAENAKQGAENGKQGAENGKQGAENGKQGAENGKQGAENGKQGVEKGKQGAEKGKQSDSELDSDDEDFPELEPGPTYFAYRVERHSTI